jgi:hypothetical protein
VAWKIIAALAVLVGVGVGRARTARGQACCAGGALLTPARLGPVEQGAVGVQLKARVARGTFDAGGGWTGLRAGEIERTFEQALVASLRFHPRAQASVLVPWIETQRRAGGLAETGGGLGDVSWTARWDFTSAGDSPFWPGVSLLLGGNAPTGTDPFSAKHPLATDATGTGFWDLSLGLGLEQLWRPWFVALNGWATWHLFRASTSDVDESQSLRYTLLALGGYLFDNDMAAAVYLNTFNEGNKSVGGASQPGTGLRLTTVGATWVWPWARWARSQVSVFADLPWHGTGRNETAAIGGTASALFVWL